MNASRTRPRLTIEAVVSQEERESLRPLTFTRPKPMLPLGPKPDNPLRPSHLSRNGSMIYHNPQDT